MAAAAGVSMGEFFRRAANAYTPAEDEPLLERMIEEMNKATAQADRAIDEALAFVEASNARIDAMEQQTGRREGA